MKQNKYQIKCKKCEKNIFNVFSCLDKNIKSKSKGKKSKMTNISQNGPGGCMCKKMVQIEKRNKPSPKQACLQPPDSFK